MAYTTIDDPSAHFQATTYSGNSSTLAVVNDGNSNLQPDWLWIKGRSGAANHRLFDSTRGNTKYLVTNNSDAEGTDTTALTSFDSDGFSLVSDGQVNDNGETFVAWQWKANGGTTSSNTDGSITTTVQANTTAGFSIVTYAGSNSASTVGHGLGAVPQVIIKKNRADDGTEWNVYYHVIGNTKSLFLNTNEAAATESAYNNTSPTSSIQTINGSGANNGDGDGMIAYFFTPIKGYSKFGSYEANNSTDGTFIYTGFKPAWVILKCVDSTGNWFLFDNKRDSSNMVTQTIYGDLNAAENTESNGLDFLSNGIKLRQSGSGGINHSGTYIYMAFAEHPFVSSKGVPTTAR